DEVDFLRPDHDVENPAAPAVEIEQDRLMGRTRSAIPAQPGHRIVDAEQHDQRRPFDAAPPAADGTRIDLYPGRIEGAAAAIHLCTHTAIVRRPARRHRW